MNGIISKNVFRNTLITTSCLIAGFVAGATFELGSSLFKKQEISFSKIAWISEDLSTKPIQFAKIDYPPIKLAQREIKLAEFRLPKIQFQHKSRGKFTHSNIRKLALIFDLSEKLSQNIFSEYRTVHSQMRNHFLYVIHEPGVSTVIPSRVADIAPIKVEIEKTVKRQTPVLVASVKNESPAKLTNIPEIKQLASKVELVMNQKFKQEKRHTATNPPIKMDTQILLAANTVFKQIEQIQHVSAIYQPEPIEQPIMYEPEVIKRSMSSAKQVEVKKIEKPTENLAAKKLANDLENKLLNELVMAQNAAIKNQTVVITQAAAIPASPKPIEPTDEVEDEERSFAKKKIRKKINLNECQLPMLKLLKPFETSASDTQICAEQNEWLSKNWDQGDEFETGWIQSKVEGFLPIVSYYSSLKESTALLIDQNSLAMLALRSGIKTLSGMGVVIGTLPQDYEIEFKGRAEEVQYFDLNAKKYFAILNVEPGAGITEINFKNDSSKSATVFTPVFADSVTYLTLNEPLKVDVSLKVLKKKIEEVSGLTVGLSTQTQVRAITQKDGSAVLRGVNLIPGYPVFVDVSSKVKTENPNPSKAWIQGYQYRYELKKSTKDGRFLLRQLPEKEIYTWLKQLRSGLSDQSAMIYAQIKKEKLDGFKKRYFMRVVPKTEKFGLEPMNYSILWNEQISESEPLEGDVPRFLSVQIPEGLSQVQVLDENRQIVQSNLIPVSPRVINVVSE